MKAIWTLGILLCCPLAFADRCEFQREINAAIAPATDQYEIAARAGSLKITGVEGSSQVEVSGRACAHSQDRLDEIGVNVDSSLAEVVIPDADSGLFSWGKNYAYVDLVVRVPAQLGLAVKDSSGDTKIESVGSLSVYDSSGDLEIGDIHGSLEVSDSSGDIEIWDISDSVSITDSSGDIFARDVGGDFVIEHDSSGNIRAQGIQGEALVVNDSSGDIRIEGVGRDVTVKRDSSGSIYVADVEGNFEVGRDSSGDIRYSSVGGNIDIPEDKY